jgi:hypothetical protein
MGDSVAAGLNITVVDPDDDYLGVEVFASSGRFACSSRIFAGLDELGEMADALEGFPVSANDTREFELGTVDPKYAGGSVRLSFATTDTLGHGTVAIECVDDDLKYSPGSAAFSFPVEPAGVDRFVTALRAVQSHRSGVAQLKSPS